MQKTRLTHMEPNMEMIAEALKLGGVDCRITGEPDDARYHGARLCAGESGAAPGLLWVTTPEAGRGARAHASAAKDGAALVCPGLDAARLLDQLNGLFQRCQDWERRMDELVFQNASLAQLCEAGAALLENPVCVHDDWFVMIARSQELAQVMPPDTIMTSTKEFIPRVIIEDFKNDTDYLETYVHRDARLWTSTPGQPPCVYVNLWDADVYRGRLLVVQYHRPFRRIDALVAEVLAQRTMALLNRKQLGIDRSHRSMDDIVYDLLRGKLADADEVSQLLTMMGWNRDDRVLCVRLSSQRPEDNAVMAHSLHSELFQAFPSGYIMFTDRQQCVLLNLSRNPSRLSMIRHTLAPLCRDYCLYAGISSPVDGLQEWRVGWHQAELALNRAFALRSDRWMVAFSECALDVLMNSIQPPLQQRHLIAPEIRALMEYDAQKGTQYFETLRVYILEERDIPRTSERLIIHRTTLLYRLKKIESLVSVNLDDPWRRLHLLLSLKILEREGQGS